MNVAQMLGSLKAFGSLMGGVDALVLGKFAELFEGMGEAKAIAVVAQISKNWTMLNRAKMRPAELERALRRIQETLTATGATAQASVYAKTLTLVEGHEQRFHARRVAGARQDGPT
jgi:hypothetical protein